MNKDWWKESVVYQIYPQSFKDTTGNGTGDINGITCSLDYLKKLGVDVLWLTPIYKSPMIDNGYDVSDYYSINPSYGTLDDFKNLLSEAHKRNIKILMDLVVNHTSDQHQWFKESKKNKTNSYSDFYIWKDPKADGSEPNNWGSSFGGSAWEYVPERDQYYLHLYAKEQPDLNWDNEKVREGIYKMMRYWLDMGIDGFRMDTINLLSKKPAFSDGPVPTNKEFGVAYSGVANGPRIHEFLQEMNQKVLRDYDIMTVGEMPNTNENQAILYTDEDRKELNMVFQFEHMHVDYGEFGRYSDVRYKLSDLRNDLAKWQFALDKKGWNSLFLGNHDQPRSVSRFGDDSTYRVESAKTLAMLMHLQKGTPYIYQGEEIGMTNAHFDSISDYRDIEAINIYNDLKKLGIEEYKIMDMLGRKSRDNARTPMQWDNTKNSGFSDGNPWIKVNKNYTEINVAANLSDENSIFYFYKKLINLRKNLPIITEGTFELLNSEDSAIFAYLRKIEGQTMVVIGSLVPHKVKMTIPDCLLKDKSELVISNYPDTNQHLADKIYLKPYEGVVYLINHV